MNNRQQYDQAVAELKAEVAAGHTVEILSGPCAPLVVKDAQSLRVYQHRLWAWLSEPPRPWGT